MWTAPPLAARLQASFRNAKPFQLVILVGDLLDLARFRERGDRRIELCFQLGIFLAQAATHPVTEDFDVIRWQPFEFAAGRPLIRVKEVIERERSGLDIIKAPGGE